MEKLFFSQIRPYFGACISLVYGLILFMWGPIDPTIEWVFVGILMFLLGIPHGAGDHLIVQKRKEMQGLPFSIARFMVSYLGVMFVYAVVWYFLPRFAFVLFILISVFHFGDLEEKDAEEDSLISIGRKLSLGTGILGWILLVHEREVRIILGDELGNLPDQIPPYIFYVILGCLILGFRRSERQRFTNTLITLLIGCLLPIIPAFVCYFAGCHAVYSLTDMSAHLGLAMKSLWLKLLPFSCLAFILGFLYVRFIGNSQFIFHGFVFLSLLTMPHFWLMHQFVKKK
jgi:beta-carotene 15,15'-dioxygenase